MPFKIFFLLFGVFLLLGVGCQKTVQSTSVPALEEAAVPVEQPVVLSSEAQKAKTECETLGGVPEVYETSLNVENEKRISCKFSDQTFCEQIDLNGGLCTKRLEKRCQSLNGTPTVKMNVEAGEYELFCSFGEGGECTQNELIKGECFAERVKNEVATSTQSLNADQSKAQVACTSLEGTASLVLSEETGEKETECTFSDGICSQRELNESKCYKQKK